MLDINGFDLVGAFGIKFHVFYISYRLRGHVIRCVPHMRIVTDPSGIMFSLCIFWE